MKPEGPLIWGELVFHTVSALHMGSVVSLPSSDQVPNLVVDDLPLVSLA